MWRRTFSQNIDDQKLHSSCITVWLKWKQWPNKILQLRFLRDLFNKTLNFQFKNFVLKVLRLQDGNLITADETVMRCSDSPAHCSDCFRPLCVLQSSPWWKTSPIWWWHEGGGRWKPATACSLRWRRTDCCWRLACPLLSAHWNCGWKEFDVSMYQL